MIDKIDKVAEPDMSDISSFRELMMINNEYISNLTSRRELFDRRHFDPRRDIDNECGYPKSADLRADDYRAMFDRESIAKRVVELLPVESWATQPMVTETSDVDKITPFEEAWKDLPTQLSGQSWHKDEESNPIWSFLRRADILSGIGSFGIILLGLDDGLPLNQPAVKRDGQKLTFIRTFDESLINIVQTETDDTNPRFGMPVMYDVSFEDTQNTSHSTSVNTTTRNVHYTRIVHVADNLLSSEIFGVPRQQPVWNRLMDLRKLLGGCAEMYWKGAFPGISWETHPQLGGDVDIQGNDLKSAIEDFRNKLQRDMITSGITANSLAPQVVDPSPQIRVELEAIAIMIGVPMRILIGSERGELASSQDMGTWNGRLQERQTNYLTPRLVVPFIDTLIMLGILPEPADGYRVEWPDMFSLSDGEKANIAKVKTETLALYIQGDVESLVPPLPYFTKIMDESVEDAESLIEMVDDLEDETGSTGEESKLLSLVGGLKGTADIMAMVGRGEITRDQAQNILALFFKMSPDDIDELIGSEVVVPIPEESISSPNPFGTQ